MVNVLSGPTQPLAVGVTVMVATTGFEVVFNPVNEAISPLPEAAKPIEGVLLVHEKVVPAVALVKAIVLVVVLAHSTWSAIVLTDGIGLIVMVKVLSGPMQPLAVGVTVMVATTGFEVEFNPVNEAISPLPEAAKPIEGVLLVQEKVVPGVALE